MKKYLILPGSTSSSILIECNSIVLKIEGRAKEGSFELAVPQDDEVGSKVGNSLSVKVPS
jgi:hypothetical protein